MSRSVVYRERETDREWDEQPRRTYTTVKRYQVPDSIRSNVGEEETKDKIIIRRERRSSPAREEVDYRTSERVREREREPEAREEVDFRFTERIAERDREPRRDIPYRVVERERDSDDRWSGGRSEHRSDHRSDHRSNYQSDYRAVERDRETVRAPSPPAQERVREFRFERERDFSPPRRERRDDHYEVERYSKETDYYSPPAPQPIIIREAAPAQPIIIRERDPAPIIIREERREPQYEFIERREVEEKSLVKREEPPSPAPPSPQPSHHSYHSHHTQHTQQPQQQDEDYFYERRVREIDRAPKRREERDDRRSEIHPKDSASNYGSDDSYEYVRKERTYDDDGDHSPNHRRHLAEGALAGVAAGELIRHHRKSQGKEAGGRAKSAIGGAAMGAIGAEAISRFRSRSRRRGGSRSRSRSSSHGDRRDRRDRRKQRSRSRSKSLSRKQQLGAAAGVLAVGALAGYALNKRNKGNETVIVNDAPPRRSRSRRRRASADSYMMDDERMGEDDKHRDPDHRNRRIAQAGLATAAAAGIWERVRSKSRGGKDRERSKSRIRTGVPIAAAGLGGAALAGLYEKNKASKEAKRDAIIEDEKGRGRRPRSRSRSRSVPAPYPDDRRSVDRGMIAYGDEPIYPDQQRGYYSDEEPGTYRRRHGGSSASQSPDNRRRRSRSRSQAGRRVAEMGAAAGVGAVAAHEIGKRNERRRTDRDRQGREDAIYDERYDPGTSPGPYNEPPSGYLPPQQNAGYPQDQTYPSSNYFPPPPTGENAYATNAPHEPFIHEQEQQQAYPAYNPADYVQPGAQQNPYDHSRGVYGDSDANLGAPYANETYAGDNRYAEPPHEERRRGRSPENVSAPVSGSVADDERSTQDADGVATPRARSTSRVRFDLGANTALSPEATREPRERYSDSETRGDSKRRHRRRKHRHEEGSRDSPQLMNDMYERPPSHATEEDSDPDGTVDLPERFDDHGNRKGEAGDLQELLGGLVGKFLGGGDDHGHGSDRESRSGRRRHRH